MSICNKYLQPIQVFILWKLYSNIMVTIYFLWNIKKDQSRISRTAHWIPQIMYTIFFIFRYGVWYDGTCQTLTWTVTTEAANQIKVYRFTNESFENFPACLLWGYLWKVLMGQVKTQIHLGVEQWPINCVFHPFFLAEPGIIIMILNNVYAMKQSIQRKQVSKLDLINYFSAHFSSWEYVYEIPS